MRLKTAPRLLIALSYDALCCRESAILKYILPFFFLHPSTIALMTNKQTGDPAK